MKQKILRQTIRQKHISMNLEQRYVQRWMRITPRSSKMHQRDRQRCMRIFSGDHEGMKHGLCWRQMDILRFCLSMVKPGPRSGLI